MSIATFGQVDTPWRKCGVMRADGTFCDKMLHEANEYTTMEHYRQSHPFTYHDKGCPPDGEFYWRYDYFQDPNTMDWFHGLLIGCDCCNIVFFIKSILPADINVANLEGC